jgi:hypothetical protein
LAFHEDRPAQKRVCLQTRSAGHQKEVKSQPLPKKVGSARDSYLPTSALGLELNSELLSMCTHAHTHTHTQVHTYTQYTTRETNHSYIGTNNRKLMLIKTSI